MELKAIDHFWPQQKIKSYLPDFLTVANVGTGYSNKLVNEAIA